MTSKPAGYSYFRWAKILGELASDEAAARGSVDSGFVLVCRGFKNDESSSVFWEIVRVASHGEHSVHYDDLHDRECEL